MTWLRPGKARCASGNHRASSPFALTQGVLLINLGTPDSPAVADVRRYLREFLSDPEVIHLPRGLGLLNRPLGALIAHFRAPKSAEMYCKIWSERGSPLYTITRDQASLLGEALPPGWQVFYAMRYGRPSIMETLAEIAAAGVTELVVVPMYPQFSGSTTGTALRELYEALKRCGHHINVYTRNIWFDDGAYIYSQANLIEEYAERHRLTPGNAHLVFSAHGLPVSYVERGDPYPAHIARTVQLVVEQLGWPADRTSVAYQSRLGPVEWLKPATDEHLKELIDQGERRLLVCPVSFTVDCLETLEEIDVRYRAAIENAGAELYLCPALNTHRPFIAALSGLVLRGPRSIKPRGSVAGADSHSESRPVQTSDYDSLVMIGVSQAGLLRVGRGPQLVHAAETDLHRIKKPQCAVPDVLRKVCAQGRVREAMVWNTCFRFEFYGFPENGECSANRECIVQRVRQNLLDVGTEDELAVNVLCGADAWHHLMRTVAGLNSGLPGDRDVVDQLRTAHRLAERSGTAGPVLGRLVSEAVELEDTLRTECEWGRFRPGYCYAALSKIADERGLNFREGQAVVVGGSTTSRSVLATLIHEFDVPSTCLTLVYRGHGGGQVKDLRKAIENGRRLRVQSYGERQAVRVMAGADLLIFGIDRREPVLDADQIRSARDFTRRPLTVIDFNSFGSAKDLDSIPGVTVIDASELNDAVSAFADTMCASERFASALGAAEEWILARIPPLRGNSTQPQLCHGQATNGTQAERDRSGSVKQGCEPAGANAHGRRPIRVEERWTTCLRCPREHADTGELASRSLT